MKTRELGKSGLKVSAIGMGCMGFSHGYGALPPESEVLRLMALAHELGCTFYDTAEVYGPFVNEELTGKGVAPSARTSCSPPSSAPSRCPGRTGRTPS